MSKRLSILLVLALLAGCASEADIHNEYADATRESPKLYILDHTYGRSITISVDGTLVWRGVVPESDVMPNITTVGIPEESHGSAMVTITGDPYADRREVSWENGNALVLHFLQDDVAVDQRTEPVIFQ
jgi:hypothetical protein